MSSTVFVMVALESNTRENTLLAYIISPLMLLPDATDNYCHISKNLIIV